ncbi:MAG: DEAD/DEAH box helicase [Gammaproteobacteria bacterium]|nr:DEAD/DEAH box helicase [Gammaproteobacteria bacterium]
MDIYEITLARIRHPNNLDESTFLSLYRRLILGDKTLTDGEKVFLLKLGVYFLNSKDDNVERLGYRIILRYSNLYEDYIPLYEVSLSRDYIPITKFIEKRYFNVARERETFSQLFIEAYQEGFKLEGDESSIYRSLGQIILDAFSDEEENIAVVAPTSYGKSEMIIKKVRNNPRKKICVIVPSKALLAQTKKVLLENDSVKKNFKKIITHPDMYRKEDETFLAVLTQERLLRLLQKNKEIAIDLVLVDEAHNILEDNERSHLLAQVLLIVKNRKIDFLINFFTPFLTDVGNLKIRNHGIEIKGLPIGEYMKIERFFAFDLGSNEMYLYDQFLNKTFPLVVENGVRSEIDFIFANKSKKNIIYLNRPITVEKFSLDLAEQREDTPLTPEIEKIVKSMGEFIHPEYNLIKCIKKGILFHHGGIPDIVRLYVEKIYSKYQNFEFIVTTSTLLEGVNIPAEKIFILSPAKGRGHLSAAQFKNLIGRVCRFKEVFNKETGSLSMLEPEVYLIKGTHAPSNFSLLTFYMTKVNSKIVIEDNVKNPLLENSEYTEKVYTGLEYLENMESGASGLQNVITPESDICKFCYTNNVQDFDILANEEILVANLENYIECGYEPISNPESLISAVVRIFFEGVSFRENKDNIVRLKDNDEARKFYSMFVDWRSKGAPYPLMISRFLRYWKIREAAGEQLIYIGPKWGDEVRAGGHQKLYVDLSKKNDVQRINLAIAKIKEEQEFIEFNILKYLEILAELGLVDESFYDQVKYGTSDKEIICMLKNGFSMELAKLLIESYRENLELTIKQDTVTYGGDLLDLMRGNQENDILIFEAENNL